MHTIRSTFFLALTLLIPGVAAPQIIVVPSPAYAHAPFQITVNSVAGGDVVEVQQPSFQVSPSVIRIDATVDVGVFSYPEPYDFSITVPPVDPGTYEVQYWSTYVEGGEVTGPTLELTTNLVVLQSLPIPTVGLGSGVVLVCLISLVGIGLLRNQGAL